MKRWVLLLPLLMACDPGATTAPSPSPPARSHEPHIAACLPENAKSLETYLDHVMDHCGMPASLHHAWDRGIFAESLDVRAKVLLAAARTDPHFRAECAADDSLAARPMVEHPKVDACARSAGFGSDPWTTDTTLLCQIDVGTYVFLDVIAAHLRADEGGPWLLEPNESLHELVKKDAEWRELRCDPAHPNVVLRRARFREAASAHDARVASGDAGMIYPKLF